MQKIGGSLDFYVHMRRLSLRSATRQHPKEAWMHGVHPRRDLWQSLRKESRGMRQVRSAGRGRILDD